MNITFIGTIDELRYILCILITELVFIFPSLEKRNNFWTRFIISTILIVASSFLYFPYLNLITSIPIKGLFFNALVIFWYIFLVILTIVYINFNFKCSFEQSLLYATLGYSIQHMEYAIFGELMSRALFPSLRENEFLYLALYCVSYILILSLAYLLLKRKFVDLKQIYFPKKKLTPFYYAFMLILVIFLTFASQNVFQNGSTSAIPNNPNYLGPVFGFLTCVLVLLTYYLLFSTNEALREKEIIDQLLYENEKQYEMKKTSIDVINQKCHDMKHQINALKRIDNSERDEILNKLEQDIMIYDIRIDTKNHILDTILMEKQLYCMSNNIKLSYLGDASLLNKMDTIDIYTLFGNALDNAIESTVKLEEEKRSIDMYIDNIDSKLVITISNFFDGNIKIENNKILTSKKDKEYHGFGVASIKNIAKKYNGKTKITTENDIFTITISLSIN